MKSIFFFLCTAAVCATATASKPRIVLDEHCNDNDRLIHHDIGHTFAKLFRGYGGFSVSKKDYQNAIVNNVHLSMSCASCYADAYICGWDHCKIHCAMAGARCDTCLHEAKCIEECNKCTGF